MTNEELQWAINEALDNVIKAADYIKTTDAPIVPNPGDSMLEFIAGHLKNLIDIQYMRASQLAVTEESRIIKGSDVGATIDDDNEK